MTPGEIHVVTIVIGDKGTVHGDLDDEIALSPPGRRRVFSVLSTSVINEQARDILEQALELLARRRQKEGLQR